MFDNISNDNDNNIQWLTLQSYKMAWSTSNPPESFITTVYIKL